MAELALSLGLTSLDLRMLTPFGRGTERLAPEPLAAAGAATRVVDAYGARLKVLVHDLPFCFAPGYEEHLAGDPARLEHHTVHVGRDGVSPAAYLATRRVHEAACAPCPRRVFCAGFHVLDDAPGPPWLVAAEDLVRPRMARV
jgi:hypothetical protein